ncbi:PAS domain S-box protein [Noviherbaspirillum aridicola]|uniref:PAS domain S-box-containing protein/diguanylate cyclase (GGDEF)-like protein n=1 Tax=Noviherbaspirillum aridicola TaxID=2849687 RepID=A0ABQ4Q6L6_9BURK|nr:PAS domain S-box protein [Noviherbaspirillum aridicola]GIZ52689.1 hypothetical protein NCCP691_27030 [Noviherbaspirillum aridicola]
MKLPEPEDFFGAPLPLHAVPPALLDDAHDGFWQVDANYTTTYANTALAAMLGYDDPAMLVGLPADRFILAEDGESHRAEQARRIAGLPGHYERRLRSSDGTVIRCRVHAMPHLDQDGRFAGASAFVRPSIDSGETARARLARFYELCPLGIALWDENGRLIEHNAAFARILGHDDASLTGLGYHELTGGRYRAAHPRLIAELEQHRRLGPYEKEYLHRAGHWVPVRVTAMAVREPDRPPCVWSTVEDITESRNAALRLRESEARYRSVVDSIKEVIFQTDEHGLWTFLNPAWTDITGYPVEDTLGTHFLDYLDPAEKQRWLDMFRPLLDRSQDHCRHELRCLHRDGGTRWLELIARLTVDSEGRRGISGTLVDVSRRKEAEEKVRLAVSVFTHAREAIMITATDGTILNVNDAFLRITGYERHEVEGRNPRILQSGRHGKEFYAALWQQLSSQGYWEGEVWNRRKNGEVYPELLTISAVRDAGGATLNYVSLFSDISAQKSHEQQLEQIAHYDALTGLPNRLLLADRVSQALARARRHGTRVAIACLDLDGFKQVNDRYGHAVGDHLLVALAGRMQQVIRECDTVARLGGDEFVAVFNDLPGNADYQTQVTRLLAAVAEPVQLGARAIHINASAGVTLFPQAEEVDADQLLRQADQAMYQAKLAGRNRYSVFDTALDRSVKGRNELLEQVRLGLRRGEFELYYQPVVHLRSGAVPFAEALLRWRHPARGLLGPMEFLPQIEDHPLIVEIGDWTLDTALAQMDAWRAGGVRIGVSVNVGARQLAQPEFVRRLQARLAAYPALMPGQLKLEVLETSALDDIGHVTTVIAACREIGVPFALDDFGTGYSSLLYLKRLPAQQIKIDQGFVRDMLDDPEDLAILEGILGLASAFRRDTVAEGVETLEHAELLLRLGCVHAQGYGIARPMPAAALPGWLRGWHPPPHWAACPTLQRDDLPLLYASVEHRAWMRALEARLAGAADSGPELDHHKCRFGIWLHGEAAQRFGSRPAFPPLLATHEAIHRMAADLLADPSAPTALPPSLLDLHRELLRHLEALQAAAGKGDAA